VLAEIDAEGLVPCIVREMSDDEAREIALIDNLQRADVPPLEEADAYEALRQQLGTDEAIAVRVGKPIEYIAKRLRLVKLGPSSRQALAERLITIDHALLLARLGLEDEEAALKWTLDRNAGSTVKLDKIIADCIERRDRPRENRYYGTYAEPETVLKLKAHIEQTSGRRLALAPWDLDDAKLVPAVGPCVGCPQNTAANNSLFGDLAIQDATCADGICFESKRAAFVQIQLVKANTEQITVRLSYKSSEAAPRMAKDGSGPNEHQVLRYGQWLDVKKGSCDYVRNGVTVDWEQGAYGLKPNGKPGVTKLVCIAVGCKVHPKSYEKKAEAGSGVRDSKAEQEKRAKNQQLHIEENKKRLAFLGAALEGVTQISAAPMRRLALEGLTEYGDPWKVSQALVPGIKKILEASPVSSAEFAKAVAIASMAGDELAVDIDFNYSDCSNNGRAELIKVVRGLGFNGPTPWDKPATESKAAKPVAKKAAKKAAKKKGGKP
jgi:ParB-like chromosome segregation protein Spo0J